MSFWKEQKLWRPYKDSWFPGAGARGWGPGRREGAGAGGEGLERDA